MRQVLSRYSPLLVSALLLCLLVYLAFPYYRYYVDPDGTSYLTISSRYATGDYARAVNGLWSPWACWLTGLLIRSGIAPVPAGCIINTLGAVGFLVGSFVLFVRFRFDRWLLWVFSMVISFFLVFAVYWQSFDDLWQCFFLLLVLCVLLLPDYGRRPRLWVVVGVLGGLAYLAKAYSFQFLLLFFFVSYWFLAEKNWKKWFVMFACTVAVLAVVAFPWIYALHEKYQIWTTSTAGPLNMSWYLVGHPTWNDSIDILIPPVYENSVYYWEDPWFVRGSLVGFLDSPQLFLRQLARIVYTGFMYVRCLAELSVFFPFLAGFMVLRLLLRAKFKELTENERLVFLFSVLLPVGYLLVHIESRYLWSALPIYVIAGVSFAAQFKNAKRLYITLAASLLVFPAFQMGKLFNEGRNEYEFAQRLREAGITRSTIVSDLHPRLLSKICYFSSNSFFVVSVQKTDGIMLSDSVRLANTKRLLADAQKNEAEYYLHAAGKLKNPGFAELFFEDMRDGRNELAGERVFEDTSTGYVLYRLPGR